MQTTICNPFGAHMLDPSLHILLDNYLIHVGLKLVQVDMQRGTTLDRGLQALREQDMMNTTDPAAIQAALEVWAPILWCSSTL